MSDSEKRLVSVVVPCYNEENMIEAFLERIRCVPQGLPEYAFGYVFVDDGSRDGTAARVVDEAGHDPRVKLVRLSRNFGHQRAITAGLDFCQGDFVVVIDADLQDPPEAIPEILGRLSGDCDLVHMVRSDRTVDSAAKRISARLFYAVMHRYVLPELAEDGPDFKGFNRQVLEALRLYRERVRFMRGILATLGFRQVSISYVRLPRYRGESKYPIRKILALARDAVVSFSVIPLRLGFIVGIPALAFAFLFGISGLVWHFAFGGLRTPGETVIITLICGFSGLILMALGAIGEYLGCLIREAKQRPLYIVRSVVNVTPNSAGNTEQIR